MKKIIIEVAFFVFWIACFTTAYAQMPQPNASDLWNYITKVSLYTNWSFWPDYQDMQEGRSPHGSLNKVYVNDLALKSERPPVAYGSIQVRETYGADKELRTITVMYKVKGYNPKDGDWFWAKYSTQGNAQVAGKPRECIGCHATRAKNDFVIVHEFKKTELNQ